MQGYPDVMGPDVEPLPWMEEWQLCRQLRWSWADCLAVPPPVREMFLLCLSVEAGLREKDRRGAGG